MTIPLMIVCLFLLTWYAQTPQPIWIVLLILEGLALLLWFTPFGTLRSLGW